MRASLRPPVILLLVTSLMYVGMLLWADRKQAIWDGLGIALSHAPYLVLATLLSYVIRFFRWWWLLRRVGYTMPLGLGMQSYLAGFAYTATPGKAGELIRIRYFAKLEVPAEYTFGTFLFERCCDLISVLLLSVFIVGRSGLGLVAVGFVAFIVGSVFLVARWPGILQSLGAVAERIHVPVLPRFLTFLYVGVGNCRSWFTARDLLVGLVSGIAAWAVVGLSFVYLLSNFVSDIPFLEALSIYPLSMLVGAASMIPGGVGSTEGALIFLLGQYGVAISTATLLAVIIRLTTLWFAVLLGFCALGYLEIYWQRKESDLQERDSV